MKISFFGRHKIKARILTICAIALTLTLASCGDDRAGTYVTGTYYNPNAETDSDAAQAEEADMDSDSTDSTTLSSELFMIISNDMQSECLVLKQLASGKQYMYYYATSTKFLDKYGNRATVSYFEPGRIVILGEKDSQGRVASVQISDEVWEYPDVTRYSVDEDRGVFTIAGTNYSYDDSLYVNSDGNLQQLSDLTDMDTLRVIGVGKKILSISVTTGHGELQLTNTEIFEGSYIQIGTKIFSEITSNMTMELAEGTYVVTVANNGYGGSTEIEITRGQTQTLDLDTLKGEGPQYGSILFAVDVEGATLQIDGEVTDYSGPASIQYGVHSLTVTADSYETYSKWLYVNSAEATIAISLASESSSSSSTAEETTDEETADEETADSATSTDSSSGGTAGSLAGSLTGGSSSDSTSALDEVELDALVDSLLEEDDDDSTSDYLSTITSLLTSLTGD